MGEPLQGFDEFADGREPTRRVFDHALQANILQALWDVRTELTRRRRAGPATYPIGAE